MKQSPALGITGQNNHAAGSLSRRMQLWGHAMKARQVLPEELNLVSRVHPTSVIAEQYRVAATQLSVLAAGRTTTIVGITSAVKGEGKTSTVVNLGYTLARDLGKRTLLIDCDFKCPTLHRYIDGAPPPGLVDLINGANSAQECLYKFADVPCSIMPVGGCGNQANVVFKTQQLASILGDLRGQFEYILLNPPPILPMADMSILARLGDLLILVVRAGSTPQHVVERALSTLRVSGQAHVVLNAVEAHTLPYYMYYNYYAASAEEKQKV